MWEQQVGHHTNTLSPGVPGVVVHSWQYCGYLRSSYFFLGLCLTVVEIFLVLFLIGSVDFLLIFCWGGGDVAFLLGGFHCGKFDRGFWYSTLHHKSFVGRLIRCLLTVGRTVHNAQLCYSCFKRYTYSICNHVYYTQKHVKIGADLGYKYHIHMNFTSLLIVYKYPLHSKRKRIHSLYGGNTPDFTYLLTP